MSTEEDARDEEKVAALRRALESEEPLPLGIRSRWEASLSAERASGGRPSGGSVGVVAVCAFVGGNALEGFEASSAVIMLTLAVGSLAYALGMRAFGAGESVS